jgi:hypothetical protein
MAAKSATTKNRRASAKGNDAKPKATAKATAAKTEVKRVTSKKFPGNRVFENRLSKFLSLANLAKAAKDAESGASLASLVAKYGPNGLDGKPLSPTKLAYAIEAYYVESGKVPKLDPKKAEAAIREGKESVPRIAARTGRSL